MRCEPHSCFMEYKVTRVGASERSRGDASDMDGENREVEWSYWEKRHRRQSREGSGERAGDANEFQMSGSERVNMALSGSARANDISRLDAIRDSRIACKDGFRDAAGSRS
jgi:hypothetical protein